MKEQYSPSPRPVEPEEHPLSVDEVYELIYQNEANENIRERYRRREELSYLLDEALEAEGVDY